MSENKTIDQLIKRIYSVYIDIKFKEFDSLKKDIMLEDIKDLYTLVKNMNTDTYSTLTQAHQKVLETIKEVEIPLHSIQLESSPQMIEKEKTQLKEETTIDNLDDIEQTNISEQEKSNLEFDFFPSEIQSTKLKPDLNPNSEDLHKNKLEELSFNIDDADKDALEKDSTPIILEEETSVLPNPTFFKENVQKNSKEIFDLIDLNTRIGLVEKFFKGNSIELSECLMKINRASSKNNAFEYLDQYAQKYNITEVDDIFNTFKELIERKFS